MNISVNAKRILIYVAFVILVSWAVALVIYNTSLMESSPASAIGVANYIIIFTPALANIFTRLVTKEGWKNLMLRPNFKRGWRFYIAAWLLPFLAVAVGGGLFYLLYPQSFDPNLGEVRKIYAVLPEIDANPWLGLLIYVVQALTTAALINGVVSMGEEFGWRAYLFPKLMELFSGAEPISTAAARKAALLVGLVWGVWHYPLFFMAARIDPSMAFPFPLLYLVSTCAFSVLLCWVTLRSGSAWTASLGHGMVNAASPLSPFLLKGAAIPSIGPGVNGIIGMMGYIILALVLLFNRKAFAVEGEGKQTKPVPQPDLA